MHRLGYAAFTLLAATTVIAVGCSDADPNGTPLDGAQFDSGTSTGTSNGGGGNPSCTNGPPPAPMDPSTLPTCCAMGQTGAAHCVPTAKVPQNVASQLAACTGGACVPDPFIKNPSLVPPSCKSLGGADGVCLSVCVTQVAQYASLLPQDSCAADEKCAPCISPLDKMSTGACDIGKGSTGGTCTNPSDPPPKAGDAGPPPAAMCPHTGAPVLDPMTLPSCDPAGGAHCLDKALVPPAMQSQLAACPTGLCVPDVFIAAGGNFIPPTCRSLDDAEGRCLDEMIPQVASQKAQLPQSTCATYERCVPCFNPLDGTDTGACKQSCDPGPKEAPKLFGKCCTENNAPQGRCIPTSQVPMSEQANLSKKDCTDATSLCVPSEMLAPTFTPMACTGTAFLTGDYTGVCLSKCLSFSFIQSLGIVQGSCDDIHECAPCKNPLTGQNTGAPGCPP
jgi:hypothetical protein